jgi:hypothetical protein
MNNPADEAGFFVLGVLDCGWFGVRSKITVIPTKVGTQALSNAEC